MNFMTHFSASNKKNILSIFSLDLYSFPELSKTFFNQNRIADKNSIVYGKELAFPECGIFDMVKAKISENGTVRKFVFSNTFTPLDISRVEVLINEISDINGPDLLGRGEFDHEDRKQLIRGKWLGRVYSDPARYGYPMIITLENNVLLLLLTINSVKKYDSLN